MGMGVVIHGKPFRQNRFFVLNEGENGSAAVSPRSIDWRQTDTANTLRLTLLLLRLHNKGDALCLPQLLAPQFQLKKRVPNDRKRSGKTRMLVMHRT